MVNSLWHLCMGLISPNRPGKAYSASFYCIFMKKSKKNIASVNLWNISVINSRKQSKTSINLPHDKWAKNKNIMEKKTRYTMVDKLGNEIYHSDSFLGFIGMTILTSLAGAVVIAIIGAIVCGIASLFN